MCQARPTIRAAERHTGGDVDDISVGPGALEVDAVRLQRQGRARLTRALLHHVAALDA